MTATIDPPDSVRRLVPTVSVAMATYNGERYLREQLDSIARQSILPTEIVITDDGSTDRTAAVVQSFADSVPFPVRFFPNPTRLRYADNFIRAAELCSGDLIAFCDQDDVWLEDKLSTCLPHFDNPSVLLVIHTAQTLLDGEKDDYCYPHFDQQETLKPGQSDPFANHPGFAMLIRRELISLADNSVRPSPLYGHDHWVWFLAACAGEIVTLPKVVSLYRQHGNNVYGAPKRMNLAGKLGVGAEIPNYLEVADGEMECSVAIASATPTAPPTWRPRLEQSTKHLALRSRLHRMRATMYAEGSGFFTRLRVFLRILAAGGYLPDRSRTRLGPRAALKDILLGVFGVFRRKAAQ